jgi:hypothetical protein
VVGGPLYRSVPVEATTTLRFTAALIQSFSDLWVIMYEIFTLFSQHISYIYHIVTIRVI